MTPTIIHGANVILNPPADWPAGECMSLAARRDGETIATAWRPTREELAALAAGGVVVFTTHGFYPPMHLTVEHVPCSCHVNVVTQDGICVQCGGSVPA